MIAVRGAEFDPHRLGRVPGHGAAGAAPPARAGSRRAVVRTVDGPPAAVARRADPDPAAPEAPPPRWPDWFYELDPMPPQPVPAAWPTATEYLRSVRAAPRPLAGTDLRDATAGPATASGRNAVVVELDHEGAGLALRCFTRASAYAAQRYRAVAALLRRAGCAAVVPARWVESAVEVGGLRWPAVVMPWAPGVPLDTAVATLLDRPDELQRLAGTWLETARSLAAAGLAHGDLQCGNVLVDGPGAVHLVDLDGFHLPEVGRPPPEFGHPDFQHPRRSARDWGPDMDGFSVLVVLLGLRALAADPDLWRFHSEENLVLSRADFARPGRTPIWARLRTCADPEVVRLTEALACACRAPVPPSTHEVLALLRPPGPVPVGDTVGGCTTGRGTPHSPTDCGCGWTAGSGCSTAAGR